MKDIVIRSAEIRKVLSLSLFLLLLVACGRSQPADLAPAPPTLTPTPTLEPTPTPTPTPVVQEPVVPDRPIVREAAVPEPPVVQEPAAPERPVEREPAAEVTLAGRYVSGSDPADYLELHPDGTFYWVLEGEGVHYAGEWDGAGSSVTLHRQQLLRWTSVEGQRLVEPDGGFWEKYGTGQDLAGLYLRLNFELLGDYLELEANGDFHLEEGGVASIGSWQASEGMLALELPFDGVTEAELDDGNIIDPDGVSWSLTSR